MSERVRVYANGLPVCSVCVQKGMTREEIEREVNLVNPTGLDHGWKVSKDATFRTGEPIPAPCSDDANREHWLMEC